MLKTQAEDIMNVWNVPYKVRLSCIGVGDSSAMAARGVAIAAGHGSGANHCGTPIGGECERVECIPSNEGLSI